jgi:hypothetical protein
MPVICKTGEALRARVLTPVVSFASPVALEPDLWFPLQPVSEIPVPFVFRVPRNSVSVVVVECFDYEFTVIVRDIQFHTVER